MTAFKRIAITGRFNRANTVASLRALIKLLEHQKIDLVLEEHTANLVPEYAYPTASQDKLAENVDLVIVIGGDGSLLYSAHSASSLGVPILGINLGRLGFLTDITPADMEEQLLTIIQGTYQIEERFLLQASHGENPKHDALNDVVLYAGSIARMIEFELYIDKQFVYSLRSDGLIIATSTGSTAYALSAGGPIVHPTLPAIVIAPLAPHTLTSRPIVVGNEAVIELVISSSRNMRPKFSCDGQVLTRLAAGDTLQIKRKEQKLKLIHPIKYNYYDTLRNKLQWGKKLGPTA